MKPMNDQFPVLKSGRSRLIDNQKVDEVRRVLWRAFQHGALSENEFASTLDRLEFATAVLEPHPGVVVAELSGAVKEVHACHTPTDPYEA
jgi:hypothetical protein